MFDAIRVKAEQAARGAALSASGALCLLVGIGFLTSALWIYLERIEDGLFASAVVGMIYLGLGLVLIAVARSGGRASDQGDPQPDRAHGVASETPTGPDAMPDPKLPPLAQAFIYGLNAGIRSGRRR